MEIGEAVLLAVGQEVAGDEVKAPEAELAGIMQLGGQEEVCEHR